MSAVAIVLVDDDKTILDSLQGQVDHLYGGRFRCETAEDAAEAWEVLDELSEEEVTVVIVVSDWLMPGTRGDVLLRDIQKRHPKVDCVLLTGQAPREAEASLIADGIVTRVLHKPWSESELRDAIDDAVARAP